MRIIRGLYNLDVSDRLMASVGQSKFRIGAKADSKSVELLVHGFVGDPFEQLDSMSVASFLSQHEDKPVNVRVNSEGGFVFDGLAIANALAAHEQQTTATIEGLAASAAAVLVTGADVIRMNETATFMVHRAWGVAVGNQEVMEDEAEILGLIDKQLITVFAKRTGLPREEVASLLEGKSDGTWMDAETALAKGFIDDIIVQPGREPETQNVAAGAAEPKRGDADQKIAVMLRRRLVDVETPPE